MVPGGSMVSTVTLMTPATMDKGIPRTRACDIECYFILLAKDNLKLSTTGFNSGKSLK